jgi:17beta-estradiol 17-dehydrogenase / very-long-chain 3-oxoacyl-CoA reductase
VKTIAADFTESQSIYPKLKAELDQLEIGILVNNVGMLFGFRPFAEFEDDKAIHDMIICNTMSVSRMTHIVLPQMMRRRRGVILNLSSLSSAIPTPFLTVYGATKVESIQN